MATEIAPVMMAIQRELPRSSFITDCEVGRF